MTRKYLSLVALTLSLTFAITLSGCGGGGDNKTDTTGGTTTGGTTTGGTTTGGTTTGGTTTGGTTTGGDTTGGTTTGGDTTTRATRTVRGYLDRVDRVVNAYDNIRVALRIIRALGRGRQAGEVIATATVGADGGYIFEKVPEGEYKLEVTSTDSSVQATEVTFTVQQAVDPNAPAVEVQRLGVIPTGVSVKEIVVTLPPVNGAGGYLINADYTFGAKVLDEAGGELAGWRPLWLVEGGIGSVNRDGVFRATSVGTGKIVAYFNQGTTVRRFEKDISVVTNELPAPTLTVLTTDGIRKVNARDGKVIAPAPSDAARPLNGNSRMAIAPDGTYYIAQVRGASNKVLRVSAEGREIGSYTVSSSAPDDIVVLPGGNVLIYVSSTKGFLILSADLQNEIQSGILTKDFSIVRDMQVSPQDGRLYVAGRDTVPSREEDGVYSYAIRDGLIGAEARKTIFSVPATTANMITGITFARNGDLLLCDSEGDNVLAYTTGGKQLQSVSLPFAEGRIAVAYGISDPNDEVVYVTTSQGVRRFAYNGGLSPFTPLDNGGVFIANTSVYDVLITPVP